MIIDITQMKRQPKPLVDMGWAGTLGGRLLINNKLHGYAATPGDC